LHRRADAFNDRASQAANAATKACGKAILTVQLRRNGLNGNMFR
jgi:hypothetical protein